MSGRGQQLTPGAAYTSPAVAHLTVNAWGLGQREAVHGTPLALVMTGKQSSLRREVSWRHLRLLQLQPRFAELLDLCLLHRHEGRIPERGGGAQVGGYSRPIAGGDGAPRGVPGVVENLLVVRSGR